MSQPAEKQLLIRDLSRGMNTFDPETSMPTGFYVDAQNMVLTNKSPISVLGLTKLNTTAVPNSEVIVWCEPYTDDAGVTTMLAATSAGALYEYTVSTDTWTPLRKGLSTTAIIWSHVPFRGNLFFSNGTDNVLRFDGTNAMPAGSVLAADMESDETWTGGAITTAEGLFQEGAQGRIVTAGNNALLTYAKTKDFTLGINGAPAFVSTDRFKIQVFKGTQAATGSIRYRFRDATTPTTKYFELTNTKSSNGWSTINVPISDFVNTGTAVWTNIGSFQIFVDTGDSFVFDDAYFRYNLAPTDGTLVEMYAQQLVVGGIATDRVAINYSDAGTPEYFPAANFARFSGGRHSLERTDQITALRSYFDELVVGKVNSAWTFSGTGTNTSISALPLTIGIDSHRGIAETPWSLQFPFENNIFGARLTSRGLVSTNISSLLQKIDGTLLENTVTIRHDRSHTVRWSFRTTDATNSQNDLGLLYDYQLDAWASKYTPKIRYYTRAIINGNRELIAVQYDGFIRRVDVGTDFDGTAIESFVTLPWVTAGSEDAQGHEVRWMNGTFYVKGTAAVMIDARFADEPNEFASAAFTTFKTVQATADGNKGFSYFGRTGRWMQLRLRATSLRFEVMMPIVIGYAETKRRN